MSGDERSLCGSGIGKTPRDHGAKVPVDLKAHSSHWPVDVRRITRQLELYSPGVVGYLSG